MYADLQRLLAALDPGRRRTARCSSPRTAARTWRNISGNLPDAPGDALAIVNGRLVLGTDVGVFVAQTSSPKSWAKVSGLPNTVYDNVRQIPGTNSVVLGTHGRGIWQVAVPRG